MTLEQLRIFIAVAERQHMTDAAHALNLTQSAVSAAIAALEERHDVLLFDRIGRGIVLTNLGRDFLPEARAVLARADEAAGCLSASTAHAHGKLRLVSSQTVANYWLPPRMQSFHTAFPGIDLSLRILNTHAACQAIVTGEADLGFVEDHVADPQITLIPAATDHLVLVARADQAAHGDDLRTAPWVFREPGSGTRAILEQALKEAGIAVMDLSVVLELPSNEAVRAAVEAGAGIAALSHLVVADALQVGRLARLAFKLPERKFFAVNATQRHVSRATQAFIQHVIAP